MKPLFISEKARADFDNIWDFVALRSETRAERVVRELHRYCQYLTTMPELGYERPEFGESIRCLNYGVYLILYSIEPDVIYIRRLWDGRQDVERLLEDLL